MTKLERLPEIAGRQLGGLEAGPALMAKIKLKAAEEKQPRKRSWRSVAALATAFVALAAGAVTWQLLPQGQEAKNGAPLIQSRSAGGFATQAPLTGDLPGGAINMTASRRQTEQTLFASTEGSAFPMVIVNGAAYRMLSYPDAISDGLLGDSLGKVNEYNVEPALGSGGIVSNAVSQGETVYAVNGFTGALAAANVNGSTRVFQRVSYAGAATIGGEGLEDTLCSASQVGWISLDGAGTVRDEDARALMQILLDGADYESTGTGGGASLQIGLTNGLILQLTAGEDTVSACGTWSCPDFFEALHEALGN